jgi:acyl-CoA reductase-like NAD-dependent aldehyde dehydrogenase
MSRKPKNQPPEDREAVLLKVRNILAEHFDVGICVVSWEGDGKTYYMDFKFGNEYAAKAIAQECEDLLWPCDDFEDDEEEEEV